MLDMLVSAALSAIPAAQRGICANRTPPAIPCVILPSPAADHPAAGGSAEDAVPWISSHVSWSGLALPQVGDLIAARTRQGVNVLGLTICAKRRSSRRDAAAVVCRTR